MVTSLVTTVRSPARHRIPGVDREVDQDLVEPAGIHPHARNGLQVELQSDALAERGVQKRKDLLDAEGTSTTADMTGS